MSSHGFEYFCGANVIVSIEGLPLLEAAGISYDVTDSRMPLYGYSSRHYDAVAEGQVSPKKSLMYLTGGNASAQHPMLSTKTSGLIT